jgi:hypothetical protein
VAWTGGAVDGAVMWMWGEDGGDLSGGEDISPPTP